MRRLALALLLFATPAWSEVRTYPASGSTTEDSFVGTTSVCSIGPQETASSVCLLSDKIVFEGLSADAFELAWASGDHTIDATVTFTADRASNDFVRMALTSTNSDARWEFCGSNSCTTATTVFLNHLGIGFGNAPNATTPLRITSAGTAQFEMITTDATAFSGLEFRGDQGANGRMVSRINSGTSATSLFGTNQSNWIWFGGLGSSLAGVFVGPLTADPVWTVTNGSIRSGPSPGPTTLTESSATDLVDFALADATVLGGRICYSVRADDGTDFQVRGGGCVSFAARAAAGTITCVMAPAAPDETNDGNAATVSTGTLTYDVTCVDNTDNTLSVEINAVSSLTQTTLESEWHLDRHFGSGQAVTPN